MAAQKQVIILGGGYIGVSVCKALNKKPDFMVTVVDPREFMFHCIASLRAHIKPGIEPGCAVPYVFTEGRGKHVKATAESVDTSAKQVKLSTGETLSYDYLVIATGSTNPVPSRIPLTASKSEYEQGCKATQAAVEKANTIVIVGAGPIGMELAGEIVQQHGVGSKEITIITNKERVGQLDATDKATQKTQAMLDRNGVKCIFNQRAGIKGEDSIDWTKLHTDCTVTYDGGEIQADVAFFCIGSRVNSDFLSDAMLDDNKYVKVEKTCQVVGQDTVFACGDVCNKDARKLFFIGDAHAKQVAQNIQRHARGRPLTDKDKAPAGSPMFVPFGSDQGVGQLPNGWVVGPFLVSKLKGKDLLRKDMFKLMGAPVPDLPREKGAGCCC